MWLSQAIRNSSHTNLTSRCEMVRVLIRNPYSNSPLLSSPLFSIFQRIFLSRNRFLGKQRKPYSVFFQFWVKFFGVVQLKFSYWTASNWSSLGSRSNWSSLSCIIGTIAHWTIFAVKLWPKMKGEPALMSSVGTICSVRILKWYQVNQLILNFKLKFNYNWTFQLHATHSVIYTPLQIFRHDSSQASLSEGRFCCQTMKLACWNPLQERIFWIILFWIFLNSRVETLF